MNVEELKRVIVNQREIIEEKRNLISPRSLHDIKVRLLSFLFVFLPKSGQ
ncbi:hypothetical protein [Saccharolobus islandicus]|nr:hypothetical protein [Sulfolobus islandicus]